MTWIDDDGVYSTHDFSFYLLRNLKHCIIDFWRNCLPSSSSSTLFFYKLMIVFIGLCCVCVCDIIKNPKMVQFAVYRTLPCSRIAWASFHFFFLSTKEKRNQSESSQTIFFLVFFSFFWIISSAHFTLDWSQGFFFTRAISHIYILIIFCINTTCHRQFWFIRHSWQFNTSAVH